MTQRTSSGRGNASSTSAGTASGTAREVADQAKETAGQVVDQAKETASQVADQARQQVTSGLSSQKERAAQGIGSVAQALRQTGQQLREQDQSGVTQYIDRAASQIERVSSYLEQNDVGQLVDDVEQFARRQPALFLGGAFVLGLLGARFLKSSRPQMPAGGDYPLMRRQSVPMRRGIYGTGYEQPGQYGAAREYGASTGEYGTAQGAQGTTDSARRRPGAEDR
jgi:hypothetical protein